jgi:hypothetical protein
MDHVILPVQSAVPMEASQFGGDVVPHPDTLNSCPLLGVKRTSRRIIAMSAFDPKRTFSLADCCHAK